MTDQATESAFERPRKRWRKTKWAYGIVLVYLAVTIVAGISWSAYSHRKFQEVVDPIIARGEPLAWSDFATDPIPDDENAAILYKKAIEGGVLKDADGQYPREFDSDTEPWSWGYDDLFHRFTTKREVRRKYAEELGKLLGMAQDAFVLCRKARRLDKVDWGTDFSGKAYYVERSPPDVGMYRQVANMLSLAAIEAHEAGRDDEAVEYLRDIVALGNSLTTVPTAINCLVAIAVHSTINKPLEQILPGIRIGEAAGDVRPGDLRGLMTELLDVSRCRQGITLAMMGERSMHYDFCCSIIDLDIPIEAIDAPRGPGSHGDEPFSNALVRGGFAFFVAPMFRIDSARLVGYMDSYVRASRLTTLPECRRVIQSMLEDGEERQADFSFTRYLSTMLTPSLRRVFELHHSGLAYRQLAGTGIAVRMYQADKGRRPDKLGDLVPGYMAEIPQDPMNEPGKPIRYINESNTPRLYSVGVNGQDDGGAYDDLSEYGIDDKEILFFLSGRPRIPKEESGDDAPDNDESD